MGTDFTLLEALVTKIVDDLNSLGYKRAVFRYDWSNALECLINVVKLRWHGEVVPEVTPEGDPASAGNAEGGVGLLKAHTRSLKYALEQNLGVQVPDTHNILTWLVYYACQSYNRFRTGSDGRTPRERVIGRKGDSPVAGFGESVWYKPLQPRGRPPPLDERFQIGYFVWFL